MTTPFVSTLRARAGTIVLGNPGANALTIRVQMPEVWDVIRLQTSPDETVRAVRARAMVELAPDSDGPDEIVVKFNGFEILDEEVTLAEAGVKNGSTLLVTFRRRRAVRSATGVGR